MNKFFAIIMPAALLAVSAFSNQQSLTSKISNKNVVATSSRSATSNDQSEEWAELNDALALQPVTTSEFLEITDTEDTRTIKLLTDFTAGSEDTHLDIAAGKNIILDLNGYVINRNLDPYGKTYDSAIYIDLIDDINLTINDSNPSVKHDGYLDTNGLWRYDPDGTYVLGEGEIEKDLNGGIITGSSRDGIFCNTAAPSSTLNNRFITLNSGSIAGNAGSSYAAAGVVVDRYATFTMNGGSIFGNYNSDNSGGVAIGTGCVFYMTGGTISGNVTKHSGAGVIINGGGTKPAEMLMTGGVISENKTLGAKAYTSGGISIDTGSLTVGGNAVIRNNTYIDQDDGNKEKIGNVSAYQSDYKDYKISLAEGDDAPRDGMCVGVDLLKYNDTTKKYERIPGRFTAKDKKLAELDTKYFSSDSPNYYVAYNSDGYFELKAPEADEKLIEISPVDNGLIYTDKQAAKVNDEITLTVIPDVGHKLVEGGLEVNGSSEGITKTGGNTYKFIMPDAKAVITAEFTELASSITMKSNPTKVEYKVGEELDLTGAVITASYPDGSTEDINVTADMVSGYDKTKAGKQTLTVTYEEQTTTFDVTVVNTPVPPYSSNTRW